MGTARCEFTVAVEKSERNSRATGMISPIVANHHELDERNKAAINSFLGTPRITGETVVLPAYYDELLAWSLKRHLERKGAQIVRILGYRYSEPVYANIRIDYHKIERVLVDGQLLIDNGSYRLAVTVGAKVFSQSLVMAEGSTNQKREIKEFADGIKTITEKENYYRNKKIEFSGWIQFMDIHAESWDNIILDPVLKAQIKASTTDLLDKRQTWTKYGLPLKRCVLLAGGVSKVKTAICRALMSETIGVTCITTDASNLDYDSVTELYHLARDLSPCIVFIMNIDRFGQNRVKYGYQQGTSLMSLLAVLSSVEEYEKIVTISTARCLDALGKAMFC